MFTFQSEGEERRASKFFSRRRDCLQGGKINKREPRPLKESLVEKI